MIKVTSNFTEIRLDDPNEGRQQFFTKIMETLEDRTFSVLKIGVDMDEGVGGFFTNRLYLDSINLGKEVQFKNNVIKFKNDQEFAIFVHEACHFLHLSRDEGQFICPPMQGESMDLERLQSEPKIRRWAEYEAGYRALLMDRAYKMFPHDRTNLEVNLQNMLNYDVKSAPKETREKFNKLMKESKDLSIDDYTKMIKEKILHNVHKFSEWQDVGHDILIDD